MTLVNARINIKTFEPGKKIFGSCAQSLIIANKEKRLIYYFN